MLAKKIYFARPMSPGGKTVMFYVSLTIQHFSKVIIKGGMRQLVSMCVLMPRVISFHLFWDVLLIRRHLKRALVSANSAYFYAIYKFSTGGPMSRGESLFTLILITIPQASL